MIRGFPGKIVRIAAVLMAVFVALGDAPDAPAVPYFASFARDRAYVREGPSYQHRVLWIYRRKELPVLVIQVYDVWRKIRDSDGTVGWVHSSMLSSRRTVVVISSSPARIRNSPRPSAPVVALAAPGVVAKLEACEAETCEVMASGTDGWIEKQDIWGVGAGEVFK